MLRMDVYLAKSHPVVSSKIGDIRVPLDARMDMGDVFDGRSVCLLDFLMPKDEGFPETVGHVIYAVQNPIDALMMGG